MSIDSDPAVGLDAPLTAAESAQRPRHRPTPRPLQAVTTQKVVGIVLIAALLGGALGALWASSRETVFEARARASYIEWVEPGATDALRERIVSQVETLEPGITDVDAGTLEIDIPQGRSFIDTYGRANSEEAARTIADTAITQLVAASAADASQRIEADRQELEASVASLQAEVDEMFAEMEEQLAIEADAEARRSVASTPEQIEETIVTSRLANDSYWEIARRRNSVIDSQAALEREIVELDSGQVYGNPFEVTTEAASATTVSSSSPIAGFLGGVGIVLGLAVVCWALFAPRTERQ